ncbi:MAG: MAPEG family protein [Micavibrio sp.]|nr:MAPEG family protein [Micavibrio sp.]
MPHAYLALLLFALLFFVLLFAMLFVRIKAVRAGVNPADFTPGNENLSAFAKRVSRAHANCYENIGFFAAIVMVTALTDNLEIMQGSALAFIAARFVQTSAHLISGAGLWLRMKGIFYAVQVFLQLYWIIKLLLPLS